MPKKLSDAQLKRQQRRFQNSLLRKKQKEEEQRQLEQLQKENVERAKKKRELLENQMKAPVFRARNLEVYEYSTGLQPPNYNCSVCLEMQCKCIKS